MTRIARTTTTLLVAFMALASFAQTAAQKAAVQLNATVQASPARITLSWTSLPSTTSITIFRKLKTATSWGTALASPAATATSYADNTVTVGTAYEYRVVRVAGGVTGQGYISTGIEVAPVDYRGKMILLVDNTFSTSLSSELTTLQNDLRADGWAVVRSNLARTSTVAAVRSTIVSAYNADPNNVKAVFIVGHLAVPYSGNINPDGHSEHLGAWPCDGYYGDVNGSWTDASVNNNGSARPENRNIPGDGKFDQSAFPSTLELQVGRVDFYDMPAYSLSETELMRAYLNKLHGFKMKLWTPTARGLVYDNLQWVSNPLAASAWRNIAPMVGASNVTAANQNATLFHQLVANQSYLWTYSSGGGLQATVGGVLTYNGADRVGTTQDFAGSSAHGGVFNMSFGSYFGDWDNKNNFLRAPLASGNALTNVWAAIPAWYFHHMAMGDNIGHSTLVSMNNTIYTPLTDGWQATMGKTHLALMGDPSLRLKFLVPPSNLVVSNAGGMASFAWSPSTEAVDGYHLYQVNASTGALTRLTNTPVTGTTYSPGSIPFSSTTEYMVRAVKLLNDPSGSYYNLSLGAFSTVGSAPVDCQGVTGGAALPGTACNDGNACTTNDVWTSACTCAGTPTTVAATIAASGSTALCSGGSVVLNANTGTGLTYAWYRNGTVISGATSSSYTATTAGSYTVMVSNGSCSNTSAATSVTVGTAPTATISSSLGLSFCSGSSTVLSTTTGTGLTYAWYRNGTLISGATASTYTASTAGSYTVTVTNGGCSATSSALVLAMSTAPTATITASAGTSLCAGTSTVLSTATGTGFTYVWSRNGTTISGATSASYTASAAGSYTVTVSNGVCSTTSAATSVTVSAAPSATITSSNGATICTNVGTVLSAPTGTGYTYVWRRNGTVITGASSSTYSTSTAGSYTVTVAVGTCSSTSAAYAVATTAPPTITCSATTSGTLSVTVSGGTSPYTYSWNTSPTQTTSSINVSTGGTYTVSVKGANGCVSTCSVTYTPVTSVVCTGLRTEAQGSWGAPNSSQSAYMTSNFAAAFPAPNYLTIGCGSRLMRFTTPAAIITALPSYGSSGMIPSGTSVNPASPNNSFAGQLVTAKLNVRFDELYPSFASATVLLKNMVVASGPLAGMTVQQVIDAADLAIGGCSSAHSVSNLNNALTQINNGYDQPGENSTFLQCPGAAAMVDQGVGAAPTLIGANDIDVSVYPNPVMGQATIDLTGVSVEDHVTVEVYNLTGSLQQQLYSGTMAADDAKRLQWNSQGYAPGVYLCRVQVGDRQRTIRVVVQ